jgi:hypothetical protein
MASVAIGCAVILMWAGLTQELRPTVELRVGARATLDEAGLRMAEATATELLATAGIRVAWRRRATRPDPVEAAAHETVIVQLLPLVKLTDRLVAGDTVRDQRTGAVTVLVYVPRLVELVAEVRTTADGRANPALASVEVGHLVGLTVAHEVGHGLGLAHASSGVMKARPSLPELLALRSATLSFRESEAARMRLTLLTQSEGQLARTRR